MAGKSFINQIGLKIVLFAACALPVSAGYIIPSALWGVGNGQVSNTVYNYSGPSGCSLGASVSTCTSNIASNQPPGFLNSPNGTSSGTISASTDSSGAHIYAEAGATGQASTDVTGYAS